jgi:hypothetical protein
MFHREKTMQTVSTPGSGKTALLFGALFGVCSGLVQTLCIIFLPGFGFLLSLLLCAAALLLAGLFASKRTGKVGTGTLAGLWCGLICSVIVVGVLGSIIFVMTRDPAFMSAVMSKLQTSNLPSSVTPQQIVLYMGLGMAMFGFFWVAVGVGLGAGIGAIGGVIGKSISPVAQYVQQPYAPYQMMPNYPQYPMPMPPTQPPSAQPTHYPYPINGAPVPPASQPKQENVSYPPPPSYYHESADQSSSTEVSNPYAEPQQPPYISPDQQQ